jgi:hypothetical protein
MVWATRLLPDGERATEQRFRLGSIAALSRDPSQFFKSIECRAEIPPSIFYRARSRKVEGD